MEKVVRTNESCCTQRRKVTFLFAAFLAYVVLYSFYYTGEQRYAERIQAAGADNYIIPRYRAHNFTSTQATHVAHVSKVGNSSRYLLDALRPYLKEMFDRIPESFSSKYRNPCWEDGGKLRCLPYFYQVGSYKCGSTDLWDKLVGHPSVIPVAKEIHWWSWRRFGYTLLPIHGSIVKRIRKKTGQKDDHSLQWYFNYVEDQATPSIKKNPKLVFGDASISNFWGLADIKLKQHFPESIEPPYYLADLIHAMQPNVKITAILRDPVEKLWTTFRLWAYRTTTIERYFNSLTVKSTTCRKKFTEKYCAFVWPAGKPLPVAPYGNVLDQGKYVLYLEEWVRTFGLENIHVIRLEDWKNNPVNELNGLIRYLELEPLSHEKISKIVSAPNSNANKKAPRNASMALETRKKIQDYYRPWNIRLAELMKDNKYLWGY